MKKAGIAAGALVVAMSAAVPVHAEMRCGWISNVMPSSLSIDDRDATWSIATIDRTADDFEKMPDTNRGDTCGCVTGTTDKQSHRFTKITGGKILPAATCQRDKSLAQAIAKRDGR